MLSGTYIGDNVYMENCIVESRSTIRPGSSYADGNGIRIVIETNERYVM